MLLSDCVSVAHELHVALSTANSDSATGGDVERDGRGQDEMKGGCVHCPRLNLVALVLSLGRPLSTPPFHLRAHIAVITLTHYGEARLQQPSGNLSQLLLSAIILWYHESIC
jgi:hypothetical protein